MVDIPEITCDQVEKDIKRIESNKATGIDGILSQNHPQRYEKLDSY